jgi:hypothetical protein
VTDVIPDVHMELWLLSHPDLRGSARIRALTEHLAAALPRSWKRFSNAGPAFRDWRPVPSSAGALDVRRKPGSGSS